MSEQLSFDELVEHFGSNQTIAKAKWFGKPCINVNGKAFAVQFGEDVAFKLAPEHLSEALKITGAKLFDPRGKGNPFKEWAQIPATESKEWAKVGQEAIAFVDSLAK